MLAWQKTDLLRETACSNVGVPGCGRRGVQVRNKLVSVCRSPLAVGIAIALQSQVAAAQETEPQVTRIDEVLVTAGVDDALYRACQALLEPGREIVLSEPTFEMLPRYATLAGGEIRSIPWMSGEFPRQETLAAINPRTGLIVVVAPNNPTGWTCSATTTRACPTSPSPP